MCFVIKLMQQESRSSSRWRPQNHGNTLHGICCSLVPTKSMNTHTHTQAQTLTLSTKPCSFRRASLSRVVFSASWAWRRDGQNVGVSENWKVYGGKSNVMHKQYVPIKAGVWELLSPPSGSESYATYANTVDTCWWTSVCSHLWPITFKTFLFQSFLFFYFEHLFSDAS